MGPQAVARVEDVEDVKGVQTKLSLPLDSPVLLMMEEEYRNTLQKGEEWDLEVLPVTQPMME